MHILILKLTPFLLCSFALWLSAITTKYSEEYRCGECSGFAGCPAANTGVLYPCPHYLAETHTAEFKEV